MGALGWPLAMTAAACSFNLRRQDLARPLARLHRRVARVGLRTSLGRRRPGCLGRRVGQEPP
eukprot:515263-Alexandrium_andersonii.AAC.1